MSYLGSLLGTSRPSLDHDDAATEHSSKPANSTKAIQKPAMAKAQESSSMKRKAVDTLSNETPKLQKANPSAKAGIPDPAQSNSRPSRLQEPGEKTIVGVKETKPRDGGDVQKPRVAAATVPSAAPPPKGSFAEIMARAKALQATKLGQGPKIMHKPVSQVKEDTRERRKKETASKALGKRAPSTHPSSRSGSEGPGKQRSVANKTKGVKSEPAPKAKRKPVEISYKGTMRPIPGQPSYRGTAAAHSSTLQKTSARDGAGRSRGKYDEDEDEEGDEEEDYDSVASSDMEAGAWDIDEEEELALMKARAEDAAAKREEDELRRQKLLRKQGFESGAARRRF